MSVHYSVIIPAHNEEENLQNLLQEIEEVMTALLEPWEVIVVDDASTDKTWDIIKKKHFLLPELKGIQLKQQSGQTAAVLTGLKNAQGTILITLDGDGQNDPHDIHLLLTALHGTDCVCGYRIRRQDTWDRRLISRIANGMRRWLLGDDIHDTGCSLKAFYASCFTNIKLFKGMHRFLPSLLMIEGFHVKEIPVSHRPRKAGKSNYSLLNRGFSTISDLLAVWWMKRRHIQVEVSHKLQTLEKQNPRSKGNVDKKVNSSDT
jgi:glycosyltransferase involved in cell wall biosynthesis